MSFTVRLGTPPKPQRLRVPALDEGRLAAFFGGAFRATAFFRRQPLRGAFERAAFFGADFLREVFFAMTRH